MIDHIFYDNEATGLSVRHDQITQFGAVKCNSDLVIEERCSHFLKLLPYVVPHPEALEVTNKTAIELSSDDLPSEYDATRNIHKFLSTKRDESRVFVTYNGLKYDDELLRTTFHRNLLDPYFNSGRNHIKIDLLDVLKMVHGLSPDAIAVPIKSDGKPNYRLEAVCPANGIKIDAHDALNDSIATRELFCLIKDRAPWAIKVAMRSGSSARVNNLLEDAIFNKTPVYSFTSFGVPKFVPLVVLTQNNRKKFIAVDPRSDIEEVKTKNIKDQLFSADSPFELITTNKFPLLFQEEEVRSLFPSYFCDNIRLKTKEINEDSGFISKAKEALLDNTYEKVNNPTSEENIYGGFYDSSDKRQISKFHSAQTWEEKSKISFYDPRLRDFSARILLEAVKNGKCTLPANKLKSLAVACEEAITRPFHKTNDRYNTISQCAEYGAGEDWLEWAKDQYGNHEVFNAMVNDQLPNKEVNSTQYAFSF